MAAIEKVGDAEGDGRGCAADADGLEGAAEGSAAEEAAFERTEDSEGEQGDDDGDAQSGGALGDDHVGQERDEAAGDVGDGDGEGGAVGLVFGGFFEAEFEAHHEVDPGFGILFEGGEDGFGVGAGDVVLVEDLEDLLFLVVGALDDLALFAVAFGGVVLGVSASGEVAAEAHGDGAGGDLGQAGEDDEAGGADGSGEAGGEGKGDGEAVGEADHGIADDLAGVEVMLVVMVGEAGGVSGREGGHPDQFRATGGRGPGGSGDRV